MKDQEKTFVHYETGKELLMSGDDREILACCAQMLARVCDISKEPIETAGKEVIKLANEWKHDKRAGKIRMKTLRNTSILHRDEPETLKNLHRR